jgi:hypothetical protein
MRSALVAAALLLLFVVGGAGIYALLWRRGVTPIVPVRAAELTGNWRAGEQNLKIEAQGGHLQVHGLAGEENRVFAASGPTRWSESSPETKVPRLLEWNGQSLDLKITHDSGRVEMVGLQRSP